MGRRLIKDFYHQDTIAVARALLGKSLFHRGPDGAVRSGLIVETEAYLGLEDPAAHSFGGRRTPRTEVMFGRPGLSYIYFIYGMHFCFNVVTAPEGTPEAVLVRALDRASGPGRLCRALGLGREQNSLDLTSDRHLWIEDSGMSVSEDEIVDGPRVGIGFGHDHVEWPLRFGVRGHPALSKPRFP